MEAAPVPVETGDTLTGRVSILNVDQLMAVLSGIADGVTVHDARFRLLYVNDAAAHSTGYRSAAEMLDAPPGDFLQKFELLSPDGTPFPL